MATSGRRTGGGTSSWRAATVLLVVTLLALGVVVGTVTSLRPLLRDASALDIDDLVVLLAGGAVLVCAGWAWVGAGVVTVEVVRSSGGRTRPAPPLARVAPAWWRRLLLAACGVALVGAGSAVPAGAAPSSVTGPEHLDSPAAGATAVGTHPVGSAAASVARGPDHPTWRTPRLAGLRLPDRPSDGPTASPSRAHPDLRAPVPASVVVRPGDCLWSLAASAPDVDADDDAQVARRVRWMWEHNRAVIGDDPDLIHPGQHLRTPNGDPDRHEESR